MIYLDSSALVKLVFDETESDDLARWLGDRQDVPKMSSAVASVEIIRTCRRRDEGAVAAARQVLSGLDLLPVTAEIIEQAALVNPSGLRGLDALHLASAQFVRDEISAFVAYDARLHSAALASGLVVAAPS